MACLHRKYLMTCDQFEQLWQRGQGRCEFCNRTPEEAGQRLLHIDHDGYLGRWAVRGLLCWRCNTGMEFDSVAPHDMVAGYEANAWYRTLGDVMPEPDDVEVLYGRWSTSWVKESDGSWCGKTWKHVTQSAGPYLMTKQEYMVSPWEWPQPPHAYRPPAGSACERERERWLAWKPPAKRGGIRRRRG